MEMIEKSIEIEVPVETAYNQWTQFEEFPQFMEGVEKVVQTDDTHLHWTVEIAGVTREWDAEITEQKPDERIAWKAVGETGNEGVITFHRLDDAKTRVMLQLGYHADDWTEKAGELTGFVERRTKSDLERFKEFIESRGQETGAWRGEVKRPDER